MFAWEWLGIQIVIVVCILAVAYSYLVGPRSPFAGNFQKQIKELEVKTKMEVGEELVNDLRALARLYVRMGKRWEADQALARALVISKQEWGEGSDPVIDILKESARLMDSMNRRAEAVNFKREIKRIRRGDDPGTKGKMDTKFRN